MTPKTKEAAANAVDARRFLLRILPSLALPMFMAIMDQTIVATALPAISVDLGGVERLPWLMVSYLIANTVAAPVYGWFGDSYGRARMLKIALAMMIAGSAACALAPSIGALIAARIAQGLGGGGLMTLSQALIGEYVPPRERGRFQGYFAAIAVTASSFGPIAGGWLTSAFNWHAVFWANIPLGLIGLLLLRRLPRSAERSSPDGFDFPGVAYFIFFVVPLLAVLEQIARFRTSQLPILAAGLALSFLALALLLRRELRLSKPLLPLRLLANPNMRSAAVMAACAGGMLVSFVTLLPLYLRAGHGFSAAQTGYFLLPFAFGIGMGSVITGRLVTRTGRTMIFPSLAQTIVCGLFVWLAFSYDRLTPLAFAGALNVIAFFMGSVMGVVQIAAQTAAGPSMLGQAAGMVQFARAVGSSLGLGLTSAALFGAFAFYDPSGTSLLSQMTAFGPQALDALSAVDRETAQRAFTMSFRAAFLTLSCIAALSAFCAWTTPVRRID